MEPMEQTLLRTERPFIQKIERLLKLCRIIQREDRMPFDHINDLSVNNKQAVPADRTGIFRKCLPGQFFTMLPFREKEYIMVKVCRRQEKQVGVMHGRIVKGIGGFYYVAPEEGEVYECRAKGIFRKEKLKPLVGDYVEFEILDPEGRTGNVVKIFPRKNQLIRPAVANIDQALVIFAVKEPNPNFMLLDRFLIAMERQNIPAVICFNKEDLGQKKEIKEIVKIYSSCGYRVLVTSAAKEAGIRELEQVLKGKTTTVAGPSGAGKSSLTNLLAPDVQMETGEISRKLGRGKHTTRHSQLIRLEKNTYLMDTPGFTSFYVEDIEKEELRHYFPEFLPYEGTCRFQGCTHTHEPGCSVKEALKEGKISSLRYDNYQEIYKELEEKRRY